jgi:hypothetical protein
VKARDPWQAPAMGKAHLIFLWIAVVAVVASFACSRQQTPGNESATGNPVTAPVDYLGAVGKAKRISEKTVDVASVTRAIQMFYVEQDRFPTDLNELVAKQYLPSVPAAPPGRRWVYNPKTGELKTAPL